MGCKGDVVEPVFPLVRCLKFLNNACRFPLVKVDCVCVTLLSGFVGSPETRDPRQGVLSAPAAGLLFCCAFPGTAPYTGLTQLSLSQ